MTETGDGTAQAKLDAEFLRGFALAGMRPGTHTTTIRSQRCAPTTSSGMTPRCPGPGTARVLSPA